VGDRWGCLIQDRASRFVVAHASGRRAETLAEAAIGRASARTAGRPFAWCSDGWRPYPVVIARAYRRPQRTGRRGRPRLQVPDGLALTQTIKHRDERGRLLRVETRAAIGGPVPRPTPVRVERLNGVLRDRLACLTRKTHAFAKTAETRDAALGLTLFAHNWLWPHPALRQPTAAPGRRYDRRTPAMALGLADHPWSWAEFLTARIQVTH
jgi:IS1 family transposase